MKIEKKRQFAHVVLGSIIIASIAVYGVLNALMLAFGLLVLGAIISELLHKGIEVPFCHEFVQHMQRKHEIHFPGKAALIFLLGVIITLVFFQSAIIAIGALMVMTYGDAASTIAGKLWGRHKIRNRSYEGTIAGIIVAFIALMFIVKPQFAFITAFIGMLSEYVPIDDSFSIPVVSAIVLTLLLASP